MLPYKIGNKSVYVFATQDCSLGAYRKDDDKGATWDAIIIEENGESGEVYFETFDSHEKAWTACENKFKKLYPVTEWKGR